MNGKQMSRRSLLQAAAGAVAAPWIVPARVLGAQAPSKTVAVGHIGVGVRGTGLIGDSSNLATARVVAVSDCWRNRREKHTAAMNTKYGGAYCKAYPDFRELIARPEIDAVVIATPDHWHVPAALLALRAGKDVYVEKPLAVSMEQLHTIRTEVGRLGRIFQYGTQQRSMTHIRHACELIRNGRLGKLKSVEITAPSYGFEGGSLDPVPVPADLDYEMWLGPAPWRPYTKDRCTEWGSYWCSDNSHGFIGGWGAHPLTDMLWALGDGPESIPVEYEGTGKWGAGLFDAPGDWDIRGKFANGVDFHFIPGSPDCARITGERGWIAISRGGLKAEPAALLDEWIGPDELNLYKSLSHMGNFVDCVRTRRPTIAPVEVAVLSDTITQLSMIAIQTGRKIKWDPQAEKIVGDTDALRLWGRALREPWRL